MGLNLKSLIKTVAPVALGALAPGLAPGMNPLLARALASEPKFILLDEPFAGIDPIAVTDLKKIITKLNKKNIGVLISDHNVRDTMNICNRVLIVNEGEIIADGHPAEISDDPLVKEVYLGENFN